VCMGVGVNMAEGGRGLGLVTGSAHGHGGGGVLPPRHRRDGLAHGGRGVTGGRAVAKALTGTFESSLLELGELLVGVILTGVLLEKVQGLGS